MSIHKLVAIATVIIPAIAAPPITLSFPAPPSGHVVQSNFLGLSLELSFLNHYFGNDVSSVPEPIINYLGAVRNHTGKQPVRLRLGGNSMDSSTYKPDQKEMMILTNPNANFNDQPVDFGPKMWDQMSAVSDKIGGGEYVVGLSLLDPADPRAKEVPTIAIAARKALGDRLDAFLLGNEPDLYTDHHKRDQYKNYTVDNYFNDFEAATTDLASISDSPLLGGPTICCHWDLGTLIQQGYIDRFKDDVKYISVQHYPQHWCDPPNHKFDLPYYGQHSETVTLAKWNAPGLVLAVQAGKELMMSEFNSASCGGIPGISNTFLAGTLWTLDYALQMATVGYGAAYIHQREAGITYNPFEAPPGPPGSPGSWTTNPGFYSLLITPQILGSGSASRIIDLNLANSMFDGSQSVGGYATYDVATGAVSRLAFFNFANVTAQGNVNQTFTIPEDVFKNTTALKLPNADPTKVTVRWLTSTNVNEQYDISWGGSTYHNSGDGKLLPDATGRPGIATLDCSKGCSVDVPGPGMAVVYLASEPAPPILTTNNSTSSSNSTGGGNGSSNPQGAASSVSQSFGLLFTLASAALGFVTLA